jgi:hypothetical protein
MRGMPEIETSPWRDARLQCGIGHTYQGRVHQVKWTTADMDGEPIWHGPSDRYDPVTCVVCGLLTWTNVPSDK